MLLGLIGDLACEVGLCVVAVDGGGGADGFTVGDQGLAVLAQAVADDGRVVGGAVVGVLGGNIDSLVDGLGGDALNSGDVGAVAVGHGHTTGGVAGLQDADGVEVAQVPVVEGDGAVAGSVLGGEVVVDGEGTLEGHGGMQIAVTAVVHKGTGLGGADAGHSGDHGLAVSGDQSLLSGGQVGVHQRVGLVLEAHLSGGTIVQHSHNQALGLSGGSGAVQNGVGVKHSMVAGNGGIDIGAVRQLGVGLEVQGITQHLGGDTVGVDGVGAVAVGHIAGDGLQSIGHGTVFVTGREGNHTHLCNASHIVHIEVDVIQDLILEGQSGVLQSQSRLGHRGGTGTVLEHHQIGNIAGAGGVGACISAKLGTGELVVDTTGRQSGVEDESAVAGGNCPSIGSIRKLEVGAGVVVQIGTVNTQSNAAADGLDGPHGQIGASNDVAGNGDVRAGELTAGQCGAHSLIGAIHQSDDDKLATGGDLGDVGYLHIAAGGSHIVGILGATGSAVAIGVAVVATGGSCSIAQGQGIIAVDNQSEGKFGIAGNEHLLIAAIVGIMQCARGGVNVGSEHIPVIVVAGLDSHIAVGSKGSSQLSVDKLVLAQICPIFLTAIVGTVDVTEQVVISSGGGVGICGTANSAGTAGIAVAGSGDGLGVACAAQVTGIGSYAALGTSGSGGNLGAVAVAAALRAHLILEDQQVGNVAGGADVGLRISTELGGVDLIIDAAGGGSSVKDKAAVAFSDRPNIGIGGHLEVGASVVVQVGTANTQGNTAAGGSDGPHRQAGTGHNTVGHGYIHAGKLAAAQSGAHSLVGTIHESNQNEVAAGGDVRQVGHLNIAGIGDNIVGIQSAALGAGAGGIAVTGSGNGFGIAVRAVGAGVGLHARGGAGGGSGHLGGVAMTGGRNGLGITVAALGAGEGLDTVGGTGGSGGHLGGIAVGAGGSLQSIGSHINVTTGGIEGDGDLTLHIQIQDIVGGGPCIIPAAVADLELIAAGSPSEGLAVGQTVAGQQIGRIVQGPIVHRTCDVVILDRCCVGDPLAGGGVVLGLGQIRGHCQRISLIAQRIIEDDVGGIGGNGQCIDAVTNLGHLRTGPAAGVLGVLAACGSPGVAVHTAPVVAGVVEVQGNRFSSRLRTATNGAGTAGVAVANVDTTGGAKTAGGMAGVAAAVILVVVDGFFMDQIAQNQNGGGDALNANGAGAVTANIHTPQRCNTGLRAMDTSLIVAPRQTVVAQVHPLGVVTGVVNNCNAIGALIVGIAADIEHDTLIIDLVVGSVVPSIAAVGTAQSGMVLTEGHQTCVVIIGHLGIVLVDQMIPADLVDIVVGAVGVIDTITVLVHLFTQKLFAGIDIRDTLRHHINCGGQVIHPNHFLPVSTVTADDDLIDQGVVIVGGNVVDGLRGAGGPAIGGAEAVGDVVSLAGVAGGEAPGMAVIAGDGVTNLIVVESQAAGNPGVALVGQAVAVLNGGSAVLVPAFAIEDDVGVLGLNGADDIVHGLSINQASVVETEAVDVILLHPVEHGVDDVVTSHGALGSDVVATAGAVGPVTLTPETGEVVGNDLVVAPVTAAIGMVVDHVHDNVDAVGVEGLNHLLELVNTDVTIERISSVGALGNIVVLRVIAPVVLLPVLQMVFIVGGEVVSRHQLNVGNAQLLQVIQSGGTALVVGAGLGHTQELALPLVLNAGGGVDGHLTDVHLVDDGIGVVHTLVGADIVGPAIGVGSIHIQDHTAVTVGAGGLCVGVNGLSGIVAEVHGIDIVLAVQVAGNAGGPDAQIATGHIDGLNPVAYAIVTAGVQLNLHILSGGSPNLEGGLGAAPGGTKIVAVVGIVSRELVGVEHTLSLDVHQTIAIDTVVTHLMGHQLTAQSQGVAPVIQSDAGDADIGSIAISIRNGKGAQGIGHRHRSLDPDLTAFIVQICVSGAAGHHHVIAQNTAAGGGAGIQVEVNGTGLHVGQIDKPIVELLIGPVSLADGIAHAGVGTAVQRIGADHTLVAADRAEGAGAAALGIPEPDVPVIVGVLTVTEEVEHDGDLVGAVAADDDNTVAFVAADHTVVGVMDPLAVHHELVFVGALGQSQGGAPNAVGVGHLVGGGAPVVEGTGHIDLGAAAAFVAESNLGAVDLGADHQIVLHRSNSALKLIVGVGVGIGLDPHFAASAQRRVINDDIRSLAAGKVVEQKTQALAGYRLISQIQSVIALVVTVDDDTGPLVQSRVAGALHGPGVGDNTVPAQRVGEVDLHIADAAGGTADGALIAAPAMGAGRAAAGADAVAVAVAHIGAASLTDAALVVGNVRAGGGIHAVAQLHGIVGIHSQSEGDLHAAGNIQLVHIGEGVGVVQRGGSNLALPAVGHIPGAVVTGLDAHIAVALEGGDELATGELVGAQCGVVFITTVVGTVDVTKQIVVDHRLSGAADGALAAGIAMGAVDAAGLAGTIAPAMAAGPSAGGAGAVLVAVGAGNAANRALTALPLMTTIGSTIGAGAIAPAMAAGHLTDRAGSAVPAVRAGGTAVLTAAVAPAMVAGGTADGTAAAGEAMAHQSAASGAKAAGVVVCVSAGGGIHAIAQLEGVVGVDGQGEGDLHAAGNEHLLAGTGGSVVEGCAGGVHIAVGHIPIIRIGLDANVAVTAEGDSKLTTGELVGAQIITVLLTAIVGTVDEAEQIILCLNIIVHGAPGTAATVPGTIGYSVAVGAVGGDGQVTGLVPFIIPVVAGIAGIHSAENNRAVSHRNICFVDSVSIGIRHTDPGIP